MKMKMFGCRIVIVVSLIKLLASFAQAQDVRLGDGANEYEGRVEMFNSAGDWVAICDLGFDYNAADVVCKQLGYIGGVRYRPGQLQPRFSVGYVPTWIVHLRCDGTESSLLECPIIQSSRYTRPDVECNYNRQASVRCVDRRSTERNRNLIRIVSVDDATTITTTPPPLPPATTQPPSTTTTEAPPTTTTTTTRSTGTSRRPQTISSLIRVIPNMTPRRTTTSSPRVQLERIRIKKDYYTNTLTGQERSGRWLPVCGIRFTMADAIVACRELQQGHPSRIRGDAAYGQQRTMISELKCEGTENSIHECPHTIESCSSLAVVECSILAPDLILDIATLQSSIKIERKHDQNLQCAREENCLSPSSYQPTHGYYGRYRALLAFSALIFNFGTADLRPPKSSGEWEWHACHRHYHSIDEFASYDILDMEGRQTGKGHKVSFCLRDDECPRGRRKYRCDSQYFTQQGISVGCGDLYDNTLDCQWIDVTDMAPGQYQLRIIVNPIKLFSELNYANNEVRCNIVITPYMTVVTNVCWRL